MESILMKPQVILYFCILSGLLVLVLPWGFAGTNMTFSNESLLLPHPNPESVRLSVWELNYHRTESFRTLTKFSIASEATHQNWDFLTTIARIGLFAVPIVILTILAASWRYLLRGSRYRVVFLLITSILALFLYMLLVGSYLTGPFITETVVNEVRYNWITLVLMVSNLVVGLGSSVYFILKRSALDSGKAS